MNEFFNEFKGYFKIECYNKDGKITDSFEDKNFIMRPARRTVAEMFSNKKNTGLNYLVLGTSGGTTTPYIPIIEENGFEKDRWHLYSEPVSTSMGETLWLFKYETVNIAGKGIYRYIGENANVLINSETFDSIFEKVTDNYTYYFRITPSDRAKSPDSVTNYALSANNSCTIGIETVNNSQNLDNTEVTFTFEIGMAEGNNQHKATDIGYGTACSLFNEAGMYFNDRLFCSKCFAPKVKDDSTRIKLIWKIIF